MIQFPEFGRHSLDGDTVSVEHEEFILTATIHLDCNNDRPDEMQDGFWPSLDPRNAGYIGPKSKSTLARRMKKAQEIMAAWYNGDWFYVGVAVTVERNGIALTGEYNNAIWGIECNFPGSDNEYLTETANDLAHAALAEARNVIAKICNCKE